MFGNFRERLHMVQQDLTTGLKTLGDKSKEAKVKRKSRLEDSFPHFSAGLELLNRYEDGWFLLHKRTTDAARAAEAVDGDVVMLSAHWEKRRAALAQLQEQLQSLPAFISGLDAVTAAIAHLEGDFEEMESRLVYLETVCCQCDQQNAKQQHIDQLEVYKKRKRKEMEALEVELNSEHAQKVAQLELARQQKLKERQKVYEEAFNQDVKQYLSGGQVQHKDLSEEDDVSALDQMTITNLSDQEALDDFLNSSTDDTSTASSLTSGPDLESYSPDSIGSSTVLVPPFNVQPAVQDAGWVLEDEAADDNLKDFQVQLDEEEVQPDVSLVSLQEPVHVRASDDSDST